MYGGTELDSTVLRPTSGNVFHKTQFSTFGQGWVGGESSKYNVLI